MNTLLNVAVQNLFVDLESESILSHELTHIVNHKTDKLYSNLVQFVRDVATTIPELECLGGKTARVVADVLYNYLRSIHWKDWGLPTYIKFNLQNSMDSSIDSEITLRKNKYSLCDYHGVKGKQRSDFSVGILQDAYYEYVGTLREIEKLISDGDYYGVKTSNKVGCFDVIHYPTYIVVGTYPDKFKDFAINSIVRVCGY